MKFKFVTAGSFRILAALLLFGFAMQAQAVWVRLMAIGPDRAEFQINKTKNVVMRPGEKIPEGVRMVSLSANYVDVEANGLPYRLILGQRVEPMVILQADRGGHFWTEVAINGRTTKAMIDTGATCIAFSRSEAERLGITFQNGRMITVSSAIGDGRAYLITLDSVQVGPIMLNGVEACVSTLPDSPSVALIGMSFLRKLEIGTDGDRLRLMQTK